MKKTFKTIVSFILIGVFAACFAACSGGTKVYVPEPGKLDIAGMATRIFNECKFDDTGLAASPNPEFTVCTVYGVDAALIAGEDGAKRVACYTASATPEMIICLEAVDAAAAQKIGGETITSLIATYINDYTNYGPEQVDKLKTHVCIINGTYLIAIVSADNTAAREFANKLLIEG